MSRLLNDVEKEKTEDKKQDTNEIQLSKCLSWLLRHGALKEGLDISTEGYVNVLELLSHKSLAGRYSLEDIIKVVETNNKKRFNLYSENGVLKICANQGHSIQFVKELKLLPIASQADSAVIHGTYYKYWPKIKQEGLSRQKRNHIHFSKGLPGDGSIISGMRKDAEVFIYLDLEKAVSSGLKFFLSANEVILSPGNEKGIIKPTYFLKVLDCNEKLLH